MIMAVFKNLSSNEVKFSYAELNFIVVGKD